MRLLRRCFAHIERDFGEEALTHMISLKRLQEECLHRSSSGYIPLPKSVELSRDEMMSSRECTSHMLESALKLGVSKGDWKPMERMIDDMQYGSGVHPKVRI